MIKNPFLCLLVFLLSLGLFACADSPSIRNISIKNTPIKNTLPIIVSPYRGIDWQAFGQYKAALHSHTANSDGASSLREVIEDHYEKGFDILAVTDHDVVNVDWVSSRDGLTQERSNAIARGEGRGGRGMLQIPYTAERSKSQHFNSFFANYASIGDDRGKAPLRDELKKVDDFGGFSHINHPGLYTAGVAGGLVGMIGSSIGLNTKKYADLFMEFPSCVGMEIVNAKDGDSKSDRILWDNILKRTMPQGRYVWGFSSDDSHSNNEIGYSFNVFVLPENTLENFKSAMLSGSFYAVGRMLKLGFGASLVGTGPVPVITGIEVDEETASITINAENCNKIEWISKGKVIARGNTVSLMVLGNRVGPYIRANVVGPGGIAFTQPFGVIW